jgi:hypothetical protein
MRNSLTQHFDCQDFDQIFNVSVLLPFYILGFHELPSIKSIYFICGATDLGLIVKAATSNL